MVRDNIHHADSVEIQLRLINKQSHDARTHNMPFASEVVALVVGDIKCVSEERDIIVEGCDGRLHRISELHPCYLALQHPLLFPRDEDGYRLDISHKRVQLREWSIAELIPITIKKRVRLTMTEWFSYRIMDKMNEVDTILRSVKLFHQFLVDGWTMIESERLLFIRRDQNVLRADKYVNLQGVTSISDSPSHIAGRCIILPSIYPRSL